MMRGAQVFLWTVCIVSSIVGAVSDVPATDKIQRHVQFDPPQTPAGDPTIAYAKTLTPEPLLILQLQTVLARFFDRDVNLAVVLQKIINEAAVAEVPAVGHILYNPNHMLFVHLPENWRSGTDVRVAALEDVRKFLEKSASVSLPLAAYTDGFDQFAILSELMRHSDSLESTNIVWSSSPRSREDAERMRYLLLRPLEQMTEMAKESQDCKRKMNGFVDDVRAGKQDSIHQMPSFSDTVKPVRFVRRGNEILVVLGETLAARYYVLALFEVRAGSCNVTWTKAIFGM